VVTNVSKDLAISTLRVHRGSRVSQKVVTTSDNAWRVDGGSKFLQNISNYTINKHNH
jgi:hypothetical protein